MTRPRKATAEALAQAKRLTARWRCRRCGQPLSPCAVCNEPAQCGEGHCVTHTPDADLWATTR